MDEKMAHLRNLLFEARENFKKAITVSLQTNGEEIIKDLVRYQKLRGEFESFLAQLREMHAVSLGFLRSADEFPDQFQKSPLGRRLKEIEEAAWDGNKPRLREEAKSFLEIVTDFAKDSLLVSNPHLEKTCLLLSIHLLNLAAAKIIKASFLRARFERGKSDG